MLKKKSIIVAEGLRTFGALVRRLRTMDYTCLIENNRAACTANYSVLAMRNKNVSMTQSIYLKSIKKG